MFSLNSYLRSDGSVDIPRWLTSMAEKRSQTEVTLIKRAIELAPENSPALLKTLIVAEILDKIGLDPTSIAAAIIHGFERTQVISEPKVRGFEEEVLYLVEGLRKMEISHVESGPQFSENIRRLLLAVVEDVRVALIRLAEKIADLRLADQIPEPLRVKMANEVLDIYAPLANRLGIYQFKWELEDLSLRVLQPSAFDHVAQKLGEYKTRKEDRIQEAIALITQAIQKHNQQPEVSQPIEAKIKGRIKSIYSVWKKMQRKGVGIEGILDVQGIRILVSTVMDCYAVLGIVHSLWQHIPKAFDDYIANPKPNGYQSLHTAVIGSDGCVLEIQIRTHEMHALSELGFAAHWRYKEGVGADAQYESKLARLRQILKWQEEWKDTAPDSLKTELFRDWIYVLTPKGEVIDLENGATVLDFAYRIHTDIGHHCRGAKVDGRIVPLTYIVKNGEKIEILTSKQGGPSRDWLNQSEGYLKTARARAKVHHWFRQQDRGKNIEEGRDLLERELKRIHANEVGYEALAIKLGFKNPEEMFVALGSGDIRIGSVLSALQKLLPGILHRAIPRRPATREKTDKRQAEVVVAGLGNVACQIARCCKPEPNDEIIGYITLGKGVSVHRRDCTNILNAKADKLPRMVQVEWAGHKRDLYTADLVAFGSDRPGLLGEICALLAKSKINVVNAQAKVKENNVAYITLTVEIAGLDLLHKTLLELQTIPGIQKVELAQ